VGWDSRTRLLTEPLSPRGPQPVYRRRTSFVVNQWTVEYSQYGMPKWAFAANPSRQDGSKRHETRQFSPHRPVKFDVCWPPRFR
jgi:hypothetical protein